MKFCDTTVDLPEEIHYPLKNELIDGILLGYTRDETPHDDPRWPACCDTCGKPFRSDSNWQHNVHRLFSGSPDGKLYTTRNMTPGSMYDASWWPVSTEDRKVVCVVLPPGGSDADHWIVDGPSKSGGAWTRSGVVPKITARPSIMTPRYHGFLTDGVLVEC
jgi:hypothetical protein